MLLAFVKFADATSNLGTLDIAHDENAADREYSFEKNRVGESEIKEVKEIIIERNKDNNTENMKISNNISSFSENHNDCSSETSKAENSENYPKLIDETNFDKNIKESAQVSNDSPEELHDKEPSEHDGKEFEEIELIIEEIIEIEESSEPLEISDEIETLEIEYDEDEANIFCENSSQPESSEELQSEFEKSQSLKQLKTYANKNKIRNKSQNDVTKNLFTEKTISSPVLSGDTDDSTCLENIDLDYEKTFSNELTNNLYDLVSSSSEENQIKGVNESKSKVKIIKSQILNKAINVKDLLKPKKTDKKNFLMEPTEKLSDYISDNKTICKKDEIETNIDHDDEFVGHEKPSEIIVTPKTMEKVLWKNVCIGNEKKLIPISTAIKIVKIPKHSKVFKVQKNDLSDTNIDLIKKQIKNDCTNEMVLSKLNSPRKSNEMRTYTYSKSIKNSLDKRFYEETNKTSYKNLKVYNSPKSSTKVTEKNSSLMLIDEYSELNGESSKCKGE